MTVGLILMTALPPTKGHGHLIKWAREYLSASGGGQLIVFLGTQPSEPMAQERYDALFNFCTNLNQEYHSVSVDLLRFHQEVQQQPENDEDHNFWDDWRYNIMSNINSYIYKPWSRDKGVADLILFSSEKYGEKLSQVLGCKHVPVDPNRELVEIKATNVRKSPIDHMDQILPEFIPYIQKTVTLFGAESTGKTTLAKQFVGWTNFGDEEFNNAQFVHEWARPYLESLSSPETTPERMEIIVNGQYAAQRTAKGTNAYITVQDTDLLSTIGYYRIYYSQYQELDGYKKCIDLFRGTKSDHYFLCPSDIKFEVDPLRYGGDKRESTDEFWTNLLEEFGCKFSVIDRSLSNFDPLRQIEEKMYDLIDECPLWGFVRNGNQ